MADLCPIEPARIRRDERALHHARDGGHPGDGSGKRLFLGPLYRRLGDVDGALPLHILEALAAFERPRISERVQAGRARVTRQGQRLGRPWRQRPPAARPTGLTVRQAAAEWGVSKSPTARGINGGAIPREGGLGAWMAHQRLQTA